MSSPVPKSLSGPAIPRSTTDPRTRFASPAGVPLPRPAPSRSAAAPAATGVEALVPLKHERNEKLSTHAAALTSGLIRPSFVGPRELYEPIDVPRAGS